MKTHHQTKILAVAIFLVFLLFGYSLGSVCGGSCLNNALTTTSIFGILGLLMGAVVAYASGIRSRKR